MNVQRLGIGIFLTCLIGFAAFSIIYAVIRLQSHQEFVSGDYAKKDHTEKTEGHDISLTESKNGRRKWMINVKHIRYNATNTAANMEGIEGTLYSDAGEVMLTFKSPEGYYDKAKNRFDLNKEVIIESPKSGIKMFAPQMVWTSTANQIEAKGGVKMSKEGFGSSQAQRAAFALDMSRVELSGGTSSVFGG